MKRKRLDRDIGWGFQYFPYYQFRLENEDFRGLASLIDLVSGKYMYWHDKKAGDIAVAGAGMKWLQLIPDGKSRAVTAMYKPDGALSVCYVDVIERVEFDPDGVAAFIDKYLDVVFTPSGEYTVQDLDELTAALLSGDITKSQYDSALKEGKEIVEELCGDISKTAERLDGILSAVNKKIENGAEPMMTKYQKELIERGLIK